MCTTRPQPPHKPRTHCTWKYLPCSACMVSVLATSTLHPAHMPQAPLVSPHPPSAKSPPPSAKYPNTACVWDGFAGSIGKTTVLGMARAESDGSMLPCPIAERGRPASLDNDCSTETATATCCSAPDAAHASGRQTAGGVRAICSCGGPSGKGLPPPETDGDGCAGSLPSSFSLSDLAALQQHHPD